MYHGLLFDASGRCIEIPSQEFNPPAAKVRAIPVVERFKWVWVWMGDPASARRVADSGYALPRRCGWRGKPGYLHYEAQLSVDHG